MTTLTMRNNGPWTGIAGITVQNYNLSSLQIDNNFWFLYSMIVALEDHATSLAVGIANFAISGNQMTVIMTDGSTRGPFILPVSIPRQRGAWQPNTTYLVNDWFTQNNSLYAVIFNHVSAATFNPNANDGMGDFYYQFLLSIAASLTETTSEIAAATFTPTPAYANNYLRMTNSGGCVVTVEEDAAQSFAAGQYVKFRQTTFGPVSVVADSGVTINVPHGVFPEGKTEGAWIKIIKTDIANTWDLEGWPLLEESGFI